MINFDAVLIEFIKNNIVTIGLVMAVLKVIAMETPWAADDKIIEIFTGFLKNRNK